MHLCMILVRHATVLQTSVLWDKRWVLAINGRLLQCVGEVSQNGVGSKHDVHPSCVAHDLFPALPNVSLIAVAMLGLICIPFYHN